MVKTATRCLLFSLLLISLNASIAAAQVATADVVGRVTDASGATVFGAQVTIENLETHSIHSTLTSASGDYALNLLSPGPYTLRIEMSGFKTEVPVINSAHKFPIYFSHVRFMPLIRHCLS
jgi:hypothetical protein